MLVETQQIDRGRQYEITKERRIQEATEEARIRKTADEGRHTEIREVKRGGGIK